MIAAALCWTSAFAQLTPKSATNCKITIKEPPRARELFKEDTLKIIALGDIMMHTLQISTALKDNETYDFSSYFQHIEKRISEADIAIANMEFTLAGKPYTGYPCFSAPDSFAEYIASVGFDVFLCANNHIFDKKGTGAERTLEIYEQLNRNHGIHHTGLRACDSENSQNKLRDNNPLFITRKGIRLAILNFTYGTNVGSGTHFPKVNKLTDKQLLKESLNKASSADFSIVFPHWGNEYTLKHSAKQRQDAEFMVTEGADAIVGSHPHVVQDYETINGVPVVYSMGNAVSNMSAPNTQVELLVEIKIIRSSNGDLRMEKPEFTWLWCSRPGGYNNDYCIIPIEEFINRRKEWVGEWDYDKMILSWNRVAQSTGIR